MRNWISLIMGLGNHNRLLLNWTGEVGMHAVAAILGAYESSLHGRIITFDEIISEEVTLYQDEINKELGFG